MPTDVGKRLALQWCLARAAATILVMAGCSAPVAAPAAAPSNPTSTGVSGRSIKIGVLADVTGTAPFAGAQEHLNTDLRIGEINAGGGINGHPLEAIYADPGSSPAQGLSMAQQLIQQDNVDVLMGGVLTPECTGVAGLAAQLHVVYLAAEGCAGEQLTTQTCNRYTFRTYPAGIQTTQPMAQYMVSTYGKRWAIVYPDYAVGQSSVDAFSAALAPLGGEITAKIPIPLSETNMTPYVTKIPTDGSVDGLTNAEVGTDLVRLKGVMQQFDIQKKLPMIGTSLTKDFFGGIFPDTLTGAIGIVVHLDPAAPDNQFDRAYIAAFRAQAQKDPPMATTAGGGSAITPGTSGYAVYANTLFLKLGMQASGFQGRSDTEKLIPALETISTPAANADFPGGGFEMNNTDHQGKMDQYVFKIDAQQETVLTTVKAHDLLPIGTCKAS